MAGVRFLCSICSINVMKFFGKKRKEITEVFTPRSPSVNNDMYIKRNDLEKRLYRSVRGSMHTFLFGESGNGKSWLYKKVLAEKGINHVVANCANASRKSSLTDEIYSVCYSVGDKTKVAFKEVTKVGSSAIIKAEASSQDEYEVYQEDKLLSSFKKLSKNKKEKSVIVLDNVETIFKDKKLMDELADIIILLDDSRYAEWQVKFLIVGVPNKVIQYFSEVKNTTSVGNRVEEMPKVSGLDYPQVLDLVERGFKEYLMIKIADTLIRRLVVHILNITLGVPQRIHEYCECLAYLIEDNKWLYDPSLLQKADESWLLKGLRESYSLIEKNLNAESTSDGRRNQVIYSLGKISNHLIDTNRVGDVIIKEFPNNKPDSNSGVGQILANLAKGKSPIITKIKNSNSYEIADPRHLMCIRVMLYKDPDTEKVEKKGFRLN
jgi:hypothetical protein